MNARYTLYATVGVLAVLLAGCSANRGAKWESTAKPDTQTVAGQSSEPEVVTFTVTPGQENTGTALTAGRDSGVPRGVVSSGPIGDTDASVENVPPTRTQLRQQNTAMTSVAPPAERVVYFDFDSSSMNEDVRATVVAHATYLRNNPAIRVRLEGHADERGSREYNLGLGELRANAVRDLLQSSGIDQSRLFVISYGEERPAEQGHDERAWRLNRRVEILY